MMLNHLIFPKPAYSSTGAIADQRLAVSNAGAGVQFGTAFNVITDFVMFDVQDADVMCTIDGSAPSATNGHRLYNGTSYTWSRAMATAAKFIRQGTVDAAIHASEIQC